MKQYQLNGNILTLNVKKAPLFVRSVMFLFAFLFFLMPLMGIIIYMARGYGFHIGFLFMLFFFGILGFYMLRMALWNTYGNEIITLNKNQINHTADYGWFKDSKKPKEIKTPIVYSIRKIGYEDDCTGGLVIGLEEPNIVCVTKMPVKELQELIAKLNEDDRK